MSISGILFTFMSSFMALFPVVNPLGGGFIVNGFISDLSEVQRRNFIKKIMVNFLMIGIGSLVVGHLVLLLFNLAIPVIQLGGGILICNTALGWLSGSAVPTPPAPVGNHDGDTGSLKEVESRIFYPLTFPICIGPGSISVIFTLMASTDIRENFLETSVNYLTIALAILSMGAILYVFLLQGNKIMKKLGPSGNLIINKLVAFFTFCIGIQIVVTGISKIFHLDIL